MADLITTDTIITLLGDDDADEEVLQIYVDLAVGEIEAYLGRPISVQTFEEDVYPDVDGKAYLLNTPVVSVTSVSYDGDVVEPDLYTTTPWGLEDLYYVARAGHVVEWDPLEGYPGFTDAVVTVEYTAGLDTPMAVNSVIAAGVIRKYRERRAEMERTQDGTTGLKEVRVEDYQYKFTDDTTGMYGSGANAILMFRSEQDFMPIKRYKRRGFA
jgi:hypothetical protein